MSANKLYIYKSYCDECPYETEELRLFADRASAEAHLRSDVEQSYGVGWDEVPEVACLDEEDEFEPDRVVIIEDSVARYFVVEEIGAPAASRTEVALSDGYRIVAERYAGEDYREINVGLENNDGVWCQDLAIIAEQYTYTECGDVKPLSGRYSVKVFADAHNEDYTDDFGIERYRDDMA